MVVVVGEIVLFAGLVGPAVPAVSAVATDAVLAMRPSIHYFLHWMPKQQQQAAASWQD